jgi:hypothetical protein
MKCVSQIGQDVLEAFAGVVYRNAEINASYFDISDHSSAIAAI